MINIFFNGKSKIFESSRLRLILLTLVTIQLLLGNISFSQCADTSNIYSFAYNGHTYEVIKENKTWTDASLCAVSRGGYLVEINDSRMKRLPFLSYLTELIPV